MLTRKPHKNAVQLGHRDAKGHARIGALGLVITRLVNVGLDGAVRHREGAGYTIFGEVRVGGGHRDHFVVFTGAELNAQKVAAAKNIVLLHTKGQNQFFSAGKTRTQLQGPQWLFFHFDQQIHLIKAARHFLGFDVDIFKVAQALQPVTRKFDALAVVPGRLQLSKLSANDFVPGSAVTSEVNFSHISAPRGVGLEHQCHTVGAAVDFIDRFNPCKCKAKIAKILRECSRGFGHVFGVVGLPHFDADHGLEFVIFAQVITL